MATDPICGMSVDETGAELKLVRDNRTYFFCSSHCLREFAEPTEELRRVRRRLAVGWPLAAAVAALTYLHPFGGWPWVAFPLATVVQFYPGWPFLRGTYDALRNRSWSMDVLIGVGTTAAYLYSVVSVVVPGRVPVAFYFDASALIVTLILTGNYLEHLTRERARSVLRRLAAMLPARATITENGRERTVEVGELRPGDRVRVRPGERFSADGRVETGRSAVNEAVVTGESLPVEKGVGDRVVAGSLNVDGLLEVTVEKVGADTLLAEIGALVAEAETSRVPLQQLADRIAALFVPVVLTLALLAALGWGLARVGFEVSLLVFVSVVITACPCAFGIATPAAIAVGTGRAAEEGILFKGRDSLERASEVDLVLTDKTGTLTVGLPSLSDVRPARGLSEVEVVDLAAAVESGSSHPLARAVVVAARARGWTGAAAADVRTEAGVGARGTVGGRSVAVLRSGERDDTGEESRWWRDAGALLEGRGRAWSLVERDGEVVGVLGFADTVADDVRGAVAALRDDGIEVVMVTGDNERAARSVAEQVGIREVRAGVSPSGKLDLIRGFQQAGHKVAFVGDGVNDAPALAAADLGIAVGAGTDVAKEASGVVLVRSRFGAVALALRLGRRTVRKVRGNLTWALGYNAVLLPIAMGALVPVFGLAVFDLLPITGALAMGLSSTTVVLNSLSLRWVSLGGAAVGAAARSPA